MNDKNRNLLVRLATAAVLLPIILWMIAKGGFYTAGMLCLASGICAGEYYHIVDRRFSPAHAVGVLGAALWPLYAAFRPAEFGNWAFWTVAVVFLFAWIFHLLRGPVATAPTGAAHLVSGMLYGGVGLTALEVVRQRPDGLSWAIGALVITWGNDTCAYFVGRFLGRTKLYPEISPNKTWEGFLGGMVGSVGGLFIARAGFFPSITPLDCVVLGLGGGIMGPLGDLCESMLKRAYQVKDSSQLIPGHGGLLDRIDALLFNAPWVFLYVTYLRGA